MALPEESRRAVLTIGVLAAFADGGKDQRERAQVRQVADNLAAEAGELPAVVQDVLLKKVTAADAAARLDDSTHRQLAYEMAVAVCDADGHTTDAERRFLDDLRAALSLDAGESAATLAEAESIIDAEFEDVPPTTAVTKPATTATTGATTDPAADAEVDAMVLRYATLNAALELLPQNLATLAILPIQTKMVYRIGQRYGHALDRRSIGEFIATLGLGATSQMLETYARKLVGGWMKKIGGGLGKTAGATATGAAFTFASTYAIGQTAKLYYQSGRSLPLDQLKSRATELTQRGRALYEQHRPQVEQQARNTNASDVLALIRRG